MQSVNMRYLASGSLQNAILVHYRFTYLVYLNIWQPIDFSHCKETGNYTWPSDLNRIPGILARTIARVKYFIIAWIFSPFLCLSRVCSVCLDDTQNQQKLASRRSNCDGN